MFITYLDTIRSFKNVILNIGTRLGICQNVCNISRKREGGDYVDIL